MTRLARQAVVRDNKPAFARWASARQPSSLRERRLACQGEAAVPFTRPASR